MAIWKLLFIPLMAVGVSGCLNDPYLYKEQQQRWNKMASKPGGMTEEEKRNYARWKGERDAHYAERDRIWSEGMARTSRDINRSVARYKAENQRIAQQSTPQRYVPKPRSERRASNETSASSSRSRSRSTSSRTRSSSSTASSGSAASVKAYRVWSYYCDFRGWRSPSDQANRPNSSRQGFAAIRPIVVTRDYGHDWTSEYEQAKRKSRRELEHRVVQSAIRLDTDLEDFNCNGGFSNEYDNRSLALEMARKERSDQDANAANHEGMTVRASSNPFL